MSKYTNNLKRLNKDSLSIAGGKGANLGVLIQAGLPVPPGFVITAAAYSKRELRHRASCASTLKLQI